MSGIKKITKGLLYSIIPKTDGYSNLRVLGGPAKGAKLRLDLRIEGSYWLGNYDQWIFDAVPFQKLIKEGNVCWDCGSYIGYYTAFFRKLVGSTGIVHTFEASIHNYDRVKFLPELNDWKNVFIHNMAVGPDHEVLEFVDNLEGSSGPYGLTKEYKEDRSELVINKVKCCGMDELVYEMNLPAPDFIKMDLESAEVQALHNGDRLFREKRPIILLELHGEAAKDAAGLFFEKYNYEGVMMGDIKERKYVVRSKSDFDKIDGVPHMALCTPL